MRFWEKVTGVAAASTVRAYGRNERRFPRPTLSNSIGNCTRPSSSLPRVRCLLRLREELKTEKKSGFWDNLVLKQTSQSKKPDEIEGWEPPTLALEDVTADAGDTASGCPPRPGWEEDGKGCSKYSSLASSGNSSRWSLRSAGKLVGIRRQSRGHLTDNWEELE